MIYGNSMGSLPLSQVLLTQFLLDIRTERHQTLVLLAVFRMIAAKSDELFANRAATVSLSLAALRVRHHALHLLTRRQTAIYIATLTAVNERLDAALYRLLASFLRV